MMKSESRAEGASQLNIYDECSGEDLPTRARKRMKKDEPSLVDL